MRVHRTFFVSEHTLDAAQVLPLLTFRSDFATTVGKWTHCVHLQFTSLSSHFECTFIDISQSFECFSLQFNAFTVECLFYEPKSQLKWKYRFDILTPPQRLRKNRIMTTIQQNNEHFIWSSHKYTYIDKWRAGKSVKSIELPANKSSRIQRKKSIYSENRERNTHSIDLFVLVSLYDFCLEKP